MCDWRVGLFHLASTCAFLVANIDGGGAHTASETATVHYFSHTTVLTSITSANISAQVEIPRHSQPKLSKSNSSETGPSAGKLRPTFFPRFDGKDPTLFPRTPFCTGCKGIICHASLKRLSTSGMLEITREGWFYFPGVQQTPVHESMNADGLKAARRPVLARRVVDRL